MIRKATPEDVQGVALLYEKMLDYEEANIKYTSWQRGIYPTVDTARAGVTHGSLYILEEDGKILASAVLDKRQPPEYKKVEWSKSVKSTEALVIHTLCVDPKFSGSGIGSALVDFAKQLALDLGCLCLRLNTTDRNTPAASLYSKNGFTVADARPILLNGQISCGKHLFMEFNF